MFMFAHHVGVELLGREFSPHGVVQHVCVFAALGLILATSAYGTAVLATRLPELLAARRREAKAVVNDRFA
ncbi:hypothetical protein SAMN05444166_7226 [Singulisphaera sp. GP187]|uniref:hypothetical protein n=1 Tax=Singulisphaera sp. GP187 TaxID=1882752 RepID=UPI00092BC0BD|nr:hypothetical protein [Singulisphaera sp. GP187]SIO63046.1 hypothetical protein SAMN05444166_7226 [Singulisphaera sp. GP187]